MLHDGLKTVWSRRLMAILPQFESHSTNQAACQNGRAALRR